MKKIMMVVLCWLLLSALPLFALPLPAPAPGTQVTPDVSTDLKLQQQKLDFFEKRLDSQNNRIGDLGLYLACFGALMTVIVVYFSWRGTREAVLAAREEARLEVEKQAKIIIGTWLGKDGRKLLATKIEESLKPELDKALAQIAKAAAVILAELEVEHQKAIENNERQAQLIKELSSRPLDKDKPLSKEQKLTVASAAQALQSKPPKDYQFDDWFMLGVQAFESDKFEIAAEHFSRAVEVTADQVQQAKALFNKGVALGQMGKNEAEIAVYDEVVRRYGDAPEAALRERVANALLNKSVALGQMGKNEAEIAVYDEVVRRYGDAPEAALRERVANERVAKALNGIGFMLLCQAKEIWQGGDETVANALLRQALEKIEAALQRKPDEPMMLGNQGYILFLLGRGDEAYSVLAKAIALGGEKLRQGELKDADIHPLQQDVEFKALLERLK